MVGDSKVGIVISTEGRNLRFEQFLGDFSVEDSFEMTVL